MKIRKTTPSGRSGKWQDVGKLETMGRALHPDTSEVTFLTFNTAEGYYVLLTAEEARMVGDYVNRPHVRRILLR